MILIDFSQLAIAGCFAFQSDFRKGQDVGKMGDIIRHAFLTSVLSYKRQYEKKYGEIVICCDGRDNWRKGAFQYYKQHRKKNREESDMDWGAIFKHVNTMKEDLIQHFPWRVIEHPNGEGDDVIAVLTKWVVETRYVLDGLYESSEPVLIVSSDGDFIQLHPLGDVKQYNPMHKKWVTTKDEDFLIEKIISGDSGDGIPSVLSPDNFIVDENSGRAKPVTVKVREKFRNLNSLDEEELRRYKRNEQLISFEYIPENIQKDIVEMYKECKISATLNDTMEYLMSKRAKLLLERIQEFKVRT